MIESNKTAYNIIVYEFLSDSIKIRQKCENISIHDLKAAPHL